MIISFCGHSNFVTTKEYEQILLSFFYDRVGDYSAEMYLGDYGNFDSFAYRCCELYKKTHPKVSLAFVTPYLDNDYLTKRLLYRENNYDSIIYPEIEDKPKRFAISYRNKFMIDKADCVVAYVTHSFGGAYSTYRYAKSKCKEIFNLGKFE